MKRLHPLLFLLLVIAGVKLSEQVYRWLAYGEERVAVKGMREQLVTAGADIVVLRAASDSMRAVVQAHDAGLEREHRSLQRYNLLAHDGTLPPDLYARYKRDLARYNLHVTERNARLRDWQEVQARYNGAADRYNLLADSIRQLATRMGEPYYAVPTPAEAAIERGVLKPMP
ncbi:MAG TPA: hypothetical protein VF746_23950 [Longimicrobium sp.]|jgi:hypothetical protein